MWHLCLLRQEPHIHTTTHIDTHTHTHKPVCIYWWPLRKVISWYKSMWQLCIHLKVLTHTCWHSQVSILLVLTAVLYLCSQVILHYTILYYILLYIISSAFDSSTVRYLTCGLFTFSSNCILFCTIEVLVLVQTNKNYKILTPLWVSHMKQEQQNSQPKIYKDIKENSIYIFKKSKLNTTNSSK